MPPVLPMRLTRHYWLTSTRWGGAFNIAQTIKQMEKQALPRSISKTKWRKNAVVIAQQEIVSTSEMVDRLKAALDAKVDPDFVVMAMNRCAVSGRFGCGG